MSNSMEQRPIGPSMAVNDIHDSLRSSPFGTDERIGRHAPRPTNHDSFELHQENCASDYFTMRPLGGAPSPPSFLSSSVELDCPDMMMRLGQPEQHLEELVRRYQTPSQKPSHDLLTPRRTNLQVQFVNGLLSPVSRYGQLQPKMCSDSRFPVDFSTPRTIEEVRAMDRTLLIPFVYPGDTYSRLASTIDRILRAYNLPTDLRTLRLPVHKNPVTPRMVRHAKLCTLYDFLGAVQLAERHRSKTPGFSF